MNSYIFHYMFKGASKISLATNSANDYLNENKQLSLEIRQISQKTNMDEMLVLSKIFKYSFWGQVIATLSSLLGMSLTLLTVYMYGSSSNFYPILFLILGNVPLFYSYFYIYKNPRLKL